MNSLLVAALGALGTATTAAVAWFVARRTSSGRIDTTEAATLWREAQAMRDALREEAASLRSEVAALRIEAVALRAEMVTLRAEAVQLRAEVVAKTDEIAELRERLEHG